jgi:hypothetical protein
MITTLSDRSGVVSGSRLQASSSTVVEFEVAYMGKVPLTASGSVLKYVIGSCLTPPTVAF